MEVLARAAVCPRVFTPQSEGGDTAAANLVKLEEIWRRAEPLIPSSAVVVGRSVEFDDLQRRWRDLLPGLPPVDGYTITDELPDPIRIGQAYVGELDADPWAPPTGTDDERTRPEHDIAEYRYRLSKARRQAVRQRLEQLTSEIDQALPLIVDGVDRTSTDEITGELPTAVRGAYSEIERLLGDTVVRVGRWGDMYRHLHFNQGHDWHDIAEMDWPSVRADVVAAGVAEDEPLPVPAVDLGVAAGGTLAGSVSTALNWGNLKAEDFERLLYDLLRSLPEFQNVQWHMHTNAADRGRDISADRVLSAGAGAVRTERVIIQAKHWLSKSVRMSDVSDNVTQMRLWDSPRVEWLIVATSGRFAPDAVAWTEKHNSDGISPRVELWADSKLESLLSRNPALPIAFGLR